MSAVDIDQTTSRWADRLEEREQRRSGTSRAQARKALAQRIGVSAGTLENLKRQRLKGVKAWVRDRIRAAILRELELEIQGLEHERQMVLASLGGSAPLEVAAIDQSLTEIREALRVAR